jgi:hypothetical protein
MIAIFYTADYVIELCYFEYNDVLIWFCGLGKWKEMLEGVQYRFEIACLDLENIATLIIMKPIIVFIGISDGANAGS